MLASLFRQRWLPAAALVAGLIAAAVPAALSLHGLSELRESVKSVTQSTDVAAQARAIRSKISQSFVSVTAVTLDDLSLRERAHVLEEADRSLGMLGPFSESVDAFAGLLSGAQLDALNEAVAIVSRSWHELRDESQGSAPEAQKAFHFLKAFDNAMLASGLLNAAEVRAANDARLQTRVAFSRIETHVNWIIAIVAVTTSLGAVALLLVWRAMAQANASNIELVTANRDLREREQDIQRGIEALRQAKDAAEAANKAKSAFLAMMSHELRTPLNAVVGFSDLMAREALGPLGSGQYREFATLIHSSGAHLTALIDDLLDLSKVEAGRLEVADDVVRIADVVDSAVSWLRPRADEASLSLEVDLAAPLPDLRGDGRRIKQILLNLLSNAVKFTPAGGRVTVGARSCADGSVALFVSDTGIGIAPQDISRALEPFGQIDNKLGRKFEGTGLGLPLVKALIELHGGRLDIRSRLDAGTTVTVIFPPSRVIAAAPADSRVKRIA